MGEKRGRRSFDREFKINTVRLVIEEGRPVREVSRTAGIQENTLHRWISQFAKDPDSAFPGTGHLKSRDEELRRLERELADTKEERDILKKALAVFSKRPERGILS